MCTRAFRSGQYLKVPPVCDVVDIYNYSLCQVTLFPFVTLIIKQNYVTIPAQLRHMSHMWHIALLPCDHTFSCYSKPKLQRTSSVSKVLLPGCASLSASSLRNYLWAWEKNDRTILRKAPLMNLCWQNDSKRLCGLVSCILVQPLTSLVPSTHLGHSWLSCTCFRMKTGRGHGHHVEAVVGL